MSVYKCSFYLPQALRSPVKRLTSEKSYEDKTWKCCFAFQFDNSNLRMLIPMISYLHKLRTKCCFFPKGIGSCKIYMRSIQIVHMIISPLVDLLCHYINTQHESLTSQPSVAQFSWLSNSSFLRILPSTTVRHRLSISDISSLIKGRD